MNPGPHQERPTIPGSERRNVRPDLRKEGKGVASRSFQLLFGRATIGSYLVEKTKTIRSSECWSCGSERQSRHHLFVKFRAIKDLWKCVGEACRWKHPRAPTVILLFQDDRATPTVLAFLQGAKVEKVVTLAHQEEEWEELDEMVLLVPNRGSPGVSSQAPATPALYWVPDTPTITDNRTIIAH